MIEPERVVEIGALRGDTTSQLLASLGAGTELHVIDPAPQFDPAEHERRGGGRFIFHRDISLNVLPELEPVDLALVDGDHNWYTVSNELRLLHERADAARRFAPVLVLHDVCWPYGRRDGYYAPERIPERFRQPCARKGLARGCGGLVERGGVNRNIWNAEHEGGPRNGVLTALEDFLVDAPSFRHVVIDAYAGLAVAADAGRLARRPRLVRYLSELATDPVRARIGAEADAVVRAAVESGSLTLG